MRVSGKMIRLTQSKIATGLQTGHVLTMLSIIDPKQGITKLLDWLAVGDFEANYRRVS